MRKTVALFSLLLLACSAQKQGVVSTIALTGDCPKNSKCTIELIKNKGIELKKDAFGNDYYELSESAATNVVKYEFSRIVKGDIQDGGYREEVIFEIEQNPDAVILTDKSLQNVKMLYGRFCFCKGQTGYYKVEKGTLAINGSKTAKTGLLEFEVNEVPQVIKSLAFQLK
jgi:Protein of unknown function (DUF2608)